MWKEIDLIIIDFTVDSNQVISYDKRLNRCEILLGQVFI